MGSTYHCLRYHLVFGTKDRRPFIGPTWIAGLHSYLGGTVRGLDGYAEAVGGIADHVHLLIHLKPTATISDFVRELKKASSVWSAEHHEPRFAWQEGYSIFTVSASLAATVRKYIERQEEHHRKTDFRAELMALLHKHGIEFQPEHLE